MKLFDPMGRYFECVARNTALVRRGVLEHEDPVPLQEKASLLGKEKVGTFDDVLEMRFVLSIEKAGDVGDVDGLGATTAGDEEVSLVAEVGGVAEIRAIRNDIAAYE